MVLTCGGCRYRPVAVYCYQDDAFLCEVCDKDAHAHAVSRAHKRVPVCCGCKRRPSQVYCYNDDAFLCASCDSIVHRANSLAASHNRTTVEDRLGRDQPRRNMDYMQDALVPDMTADRPVADGWNYLDALFDEFAGNKQTDRKGQQEHTVFDFFDREESGHPFQDALVPTLSRDSAERRRVSIESLKSNARRPSFESLLGDDTLMGFLQADAKVGSLLEVPAAHAVPDAAVPTARIVPEAPPAALPRPAEHAPVQEAGWCETELEMPVLELETVPFAERMRDPKHVQKRIEALERYRSKRERRQFKKTIRYQSRKAYAEVRPRIKGRFATKEEVEAMKAEAIAEATAKGLPIPEWCLPKTSRGRGRGRRVAAHPSASVSKAAAAAAATDALVPCLAN